MRLQLLLALTCAFSISLAHGIPFSNSTADIGRRALSVNYEGRGYRGPWPIANAGHERNVRPIRYAYDDALSRNGLKDVIEAAIQKWAPAFQRSSLRIVRDSRATSTQLMENILGSQRDCLIIHERKPGQHSESTVGFYYGPMSTTVEYRQGANHHHLWMSKTGNWDEDVRVATHELGHALGLYHEHQRPDRDQYLMFDPEELKGWDSFVERVKAFARPPEYPVGMDLQEKLNKICQDEQLLNSPEIDFELMSNFRKYSAREAQDLRFNREFDFNSIMLYSSLHGAKDDSSLPLRRRVPPMLAGGYVAMGGNMDPRLAGPSQGDIERVEELYPENAGASNWG